MGASGAVRSMTSLVTRRAVIAAMSAAPVLAKAADAWSIDVEAGDIVVRVGLQEVWRSPAGSIEQTFGRAVEIERPAPSLLRLVGGVLLGQSDVILELQFQPSPRTALQVAALLSTPFGPPIRFAARDLAYDDGPDWSLRANLTSGMAGKLRRTVAGSHIHPEGADAIQLAKSLAIRLTAGGNGFVVVPGLPNFRRLRLLSGLTEDPAEPSLREFALGEEPVASTRRLSIGNHADCRAAVDVPVDAGRAVILATPGAPVRRMVRTAEAIATAAGLQLKVESPRGTDASFAGAPGTRLSHWLDSEGRGAVGLSLVLADEDRLIETPSGGFVIRGDAGNRASVVVMAQAGRLRSFDVSAALSHYAIGLKHADIGRFDFHGARCAFALNGLPPAPTDGTVLLTDRAPANCRPVELSLDRATLLTVRSRDHMSITYRFRDVRLLAGDGKPELFPGRAAVLIAELPPQHIAEQAFSRALPNLPGPIAGSDERFEAYIGERAKRQKLMLEGQIQVAHGFKDFVDAWGSAIKESAPWRPDDAKDQPDSVWLGPAQIGSV